MAWRKNKSRNNSWAGRYHRVKRWEAPGFYAAVDELQVRRSPRCLIGRWSSWHQTHTHSASQNYGSLLDRTSLLKLDAQVVRQDSLLVFWESTSRTGCWVFATFFPSFFFLECFMIAGKRISGALTPPPDLCGQNEFYTHTGLHSAAKAGLFQKLQYARSSRCLQLNCSHYFIYRKGLLLQSTQVLSRNSEDPGNPSVSFDHADSLKSVWWSFHEHKRQGKTPGEEKGGETHADRESEPEP